MLRLNPQKEVVVGGQREQQLPIRSREREQLSIRANNCKTRVLDNELMLRRPRDTLSVLETGISAHVLLQ